ncbi:hypothetical protein [Hymenobacter metallicola]|uniref:Exo-alpha-sialidase n=1 Tax=Hymenobacter metallicola TaxID=2563114 RepID=A0A4Z0QDL0_9BACT|nr:hypothetical protein [Hymenobacter metallicola]TGE28137.1 hypothetical protein E5K02_01340 [Hymenobacter metallicola]
MRPYSLLLIAGLLATACQKQEAVAPAEAPDPDWIKLEISTVFSGDEAYSMAGDLDKTLLVSTNQKVYSTADQGKTWQESYNFFGPVHLLPRHDTVFALRALPALLEGEPLAGYADMFTVDLGKTWTYTSVAYPRGQYRNLTQIIGRVEAAGITYQVRENFKPQPNSTSRLVLASDLLRVAGNESKAMRLPARHYLNGVYLDSNNRLYVGASGLRFDEATGEVITPKGKLPAVIYVSRKPLP